MRTYKIKIIRKFVPTEELLGDIKAVAERLKTVRISARQYDRLGKFSSATVIRRVGSWTAVLGGLGLRPARNSGVTDVELFENLKAAWEAIGRQPRVLDLRWPVSRCSVGPYRSRFGGWTQTLEAFDRFLNPRGRVVDLPVVRRKIVSTHINWRMRYQILMRDHFRCRACGRSPATDANVTLQIDHVHPRSRGGVSTLENLQTLCQGCNYGKSDLVTDGDFSSPPHIPATDSRPAAPRWKKSNRAKNAQPTLARRQSPAGERRSG